jgi:hypothetical protein
MTATDDCIETVHVYFRIEDTKREKLETIVAERGIPCDDLVGLVVGDILGE